MVTTRSASRSPAKVKVSPTEQFPDYQRQPTDEPPFTIGQLRRAIPPHCFKRSTLRSVSYLFTDLLMVATLYFASTFIDTAPVPAAVRWALWAVYWYFQGAVATGVWVIGHECGHQAFSDHQSINDGIGLIFHSLLLVPYYSWKHSHRRHHANTNSVDRDEVFVPVVHSTPHQQPSVFDQNVIVRAVKIAIGVFLGWPLYLFFNVASRPYPKRTWVNHFDPWSPIFSKRERVEVAVSDAALVLVCCGLSAAAQQWGWWWLMKTYGVPYVIVNFWLVTITMLQHTHPSVPHYTGAEWTWLRGALATVDRNYGVVLNTLHHHIADTHVAHHLFSGMPHYHATEATAALKPVLGDYYQSDSRWIGRALWEDWVFCRYVAPDDDDGSGGSSGGSSGSSGGSGVLWQRK